MMSEEQVYNEQLAAAKQFVESERFQDVVRPYSVEDVVALSPEVPRTYAAAFQARKAWTMFQKLRLEGECSWTFGALDPVQVAQMAPELSSVYVSGWQCSSTAASNREVGPDLAAYPYDTVPKKVDQLFRAQEFHARKHREERLRMTPEERAAAAAPKDLMPPIIADADAGHGGTVATMALTKAFIEAGAAGVHLEDQDTANKKCGHMAGKTLVPVQQHIQRLVAARLQADIMQTELLIVARTDAEASTLITSTIDPRDHRFVRGCTNPELGPLQDLMREQQAAGSLGAELCDSEAAWMERAGLMTYPEAVLRAVEAEAGADKKEKLAKWEEFMAFRKEGHSLRDMRAFAKAELGVDPFFDWDLPRTTEGFYRFQGGLEACVTRGVAFSPYSDLLWMETKKPVFEEARAFVEGVRAGLGDAAVAERQLFAYNLSPSFNWSACGMSDEQIADFIPRLAGLGFVWQFITLAGFHADALATTEFARAYAKDKMLAYVNLIQRQEAEKNVDTLTHQRWSGANFVDRILKVASGGLVSTTAMQKGNTEVQFNKEG